MNRNDPFGSLARQWMALGPFAAQVVGTRLAMLPWMALSSPAAACEETRLMFEEKHSALTETGMRAAMLPWMISMRAVFSPMGMAAAMGPMLVGAFVTPSRRRVHANLRRLRKLPPPQLPLQPMLSLPGPDRR